MNPWDRVKHPVQPPMPCTGVRLRLLSDGEFSEVLRSNLLPQAQTEVFHRLWGVLGLNEDLSTRTFDVLERWLDEVEQLDDLAGRPKKFRETCESAWNRLTGIREFDSRPALVPSPGTAGWQLAHAIAAHEQAVQDATPVDVVLWAVLRNARDRQRRNPHNTKAWRYTPSLVSQFVDAIKDHRDLFDGAPRAADTQLWGVLR